MISHKIKVKDIQSKNIVPGGDFNVIFDISLESLGEIHVWKRNQLQNWFKSKKSLIYVIYGESETLK